MATAQEFEFPAEYQRQLAEWLPDPVKFPTDKWIIELQNKEWQPAVTDPHQLTYTYSWTPYDINHILLPDFCW